MTLITCSSYNAKAYRLFDTFRQHNPNDKIIWILADTKPLSVADTGLIKEYFGNMEIVYFCVDKEFWIYKPVQYQPQWTLIMDVVNKLPDAEIILRCDAFDVLLQNNYQSGHIKDNQVFCGSENIAYKDNVGAIWWWDDTKKLIYGDDIVMNSGVLTSTAKTFKKLSIEMAYGNYPGVYSDQALLHSVVRRINIELISKNNILSMCVNNVSVDDYGIACNGVYPAIVHFSGAGAYKHIYDLMQKTFSNEKCLEIEKQILGYNL